MGRRPITTGGVKSSSTRNAVLFPAVSPFLPRGGHHTFGLAALAVIIPPNGELQPATPPCHCSTITHQLTWCQSRLFAGALGELGPRLENTILEYVILQHSLCRRARFSSPAAGVLRTAADASTPRGSASCADPRGVLLSCLEAPCFKELYVIRRERSLQPHVMLPPHTASILLLRPLIMQLAAAACCCWCRELQWRLEEANLEIFILRGSS